MKQRPITTDSHYSTTTTANLVTVKLLLVLGSGKIGKLLSGERRDGGEALHKVELGVYGMKAIKSVETERKEVSRKKRKK